MKKSAEKKSTFDIAIKTIKYFFPIAWKAHKVFFFFGALGVIVTALTPFVGIMLSPMIIDELMGERNIQRLALYAAVVVLAEAFGMLATSLIGIVIEKYDEKYQNLFSELMSKRVMELDFQHTEDKKALDQINLAREGMSWYSGGVVGIFQQVFNIAVNVGIIMGVMIIILTKAPLLFLITAVLLVINALIRSKENKIDIEFYSRLAKSNRIFGYLGWSLTDFRYGKDIRLYGAADMMANKWDAYNDNQIKEWKWQADKHLPLNMLSVAAGAVRDFGSYFYLGILAILGKITIGAFTQLLTASATFNSSMNNLIYNVQEIIKRTNYAYEYIKFMDYPAAIEKGERHTKNTPHTIEFRNVGFTYPNTDVKVLENVNITIKQGEHLSVVGLNGAGKTTFIKLLCRLYDPTEGEILLDGVNIKEYDYAEYMSLFSPVFQDFKLFSFTIKENIALNEDCTDDELDKLIEQVGLSEKIASLENGTATNLFKAFDENGIEPSGGEQQKIAIARALYKKAPVVILDEPTAALDPVAEYDIYRQFDTLVGGKTAIYISHRLSSCKFCDRIAVFSEGRIKEYGTHDELAVLDGGVYAEMFAAQAQYYKE